MSHRRNNGHSIPPFSALLWPVITVLFIVSAGGVFILGCAPDVAEVGETQPAPLPQSTPDVLTTGNPALSESLSSPDGSVVVILPGGLKAGKPLLVYRDLATGSAEKLSSGYSLSARSFYVALQAPGGAAWQPPSLEPVTLAVRLTERDYDLADGDPHRLVVQRYDDAKQVWEEAPTLLDIPWLRVHVTTDSLGLFATTIKLKDDVANPAAASTEVLPSPLPSIPARSQAVPVSPVTQTPVSTPAGGPRRAAGETPTPTVIPSPMPPPTPTPDQPSTPAVALTAALTVAPVSTPEPTIAPTPTSTLTPIPTATLVPAATPAPAPTRTPTPTATPASSSTPVPGHILFINGRQVLSRDSEFYVPLGIVKLDSLPNPDGTYPAGTLVSFDVALSAEDSDMRISGADAVQDTRAELRMNGDRFVTVYISPPPKPTPTPIPTPAPTATPVPGYLLFINDQQVYPEDSEFYVPLGIVALDSLPNPDGKYPMGTLVSFDVALPVANSNVQISGADFVDGAYAEFRMDYQRFVNIHISPPPALAPTPVPTDTSASMPTPTPTPPAESQPAPVPAPSPAPIPLGYPHEGRVAYQTNLDGNDEIYVIDCDGSEPRNLTSHTDDDREPSWASGGLLAFSSNRDSPDDGKDKFDIYLLYTETEPDRAFRVTEHPASDESPALSPDGGKVAFVSHRDGNPEIYVLDIAAQTLANVTNNDAADLDPAWSPDGARLAFASDRDGDFDIYVANASGEGVQKLDKLSATGRDDRWPDFVDYSGDEWLTFASNPEENWEIYTYSDKEGLTKLTNNSDNENIPIDASPAWGPSG